MRRRLAVITSAALAGAAGLGLEAVLLPTAGLALGHGRAAAMGLAVFIAGWAIGARCAGRWRVSVGGGLLVAGSVVFTASVLVPRLLLHAGSGGIGAFAAGALGLLALLAVALPLGAFLPLLVRAGAGAGNRPAAGVTALFAANLTGAVLGAWFFADFVVARRGRLDAALLAGVTALVAAALTARLAGGAGIDGSDGSDDRGRPGASAARANGAGLAAGCVVGLCTAWVAGLEWICLRLGVLWMGGMQNALAAILGASMIALAVGAWSLPHLLHRDRRGVVELLGLCVPASLWPLVAGQALGALPDDVPRLVRALVLVGPTLTPFGAIVPVVHRTLEGESSARLGDLLLHEAWGALIGVPLIHAVLVPGLGLGGATGAVAVFGAIALVAQKGALARAAAALTALVALALAWLAPTPALDSPPLANPAFTLRAFEEDADFAVTVVDDGVLGERTLLTDGFRAAGTGDAYRYMRALGHLPLLLHPDPERVAVLALGTGTTLGSVSLHSEPEAIDVLELSAAVVRQAHWFEEVNRGALGDDPDPRVRVVLGDGRRTLTANGPYDVITMEPLLPDSPFGVYLYTAEFYARARSALAPGGLLCQWVPPHALEPETFEAVVDAFARAFAWSSVWQFGTQVVLVGGDARPELRPSGAPGISGTPGRDELRFALDELGLASPAAVCARFVAEGSAWPACERPLQDADPWVIYRPRRRGRVLLTDLPLNLARLVEREEELPGTWLRALGSTSPSQTSTGTTGFANATRYREGIAALRRARVAHAVEEARRVGADPGPLPASAQGTYLEHMGRALARCADDPEVRALVRERRFLDAMRQGVTALGLGTTAATSRTAAEHLTDALELRPWRADAHLYLAVALDRLESRATGRAVEEARRLCPGIFATTAGLRALALGLDPAFAEPRQ